MKTVLSAIAVIAAGLTATAASAQTMPMGEEIYDKTVQVRFADGTVNNLTFQRNGNLVINGPYNATTRGTWAVQGNQLCLMASGATECWNYDSRFVANQRVDLVSSCNSQAEWLASSVNPMQQPMQQQQPSQTVQPVDRSGERG